MPTLTPGTNTYVTLAQAETHFDNRLHAAVWTDTDDDDTKARALLMAAMLLDRHMIWKGCKLDPEQVMEWPRRGISWAPPGVVPPGVKVAQMELALLLITTDTTATPDTAGISRLDVAGAVSLTIAPSDRIKPIPDAVFDYVRMYGSRAGGVMSISLTR